MIRFSGVRQTILRARSCCKQYEKGDSINKCIALFYPSPEPAYGLPAPYECQVAALFNRFCCGYSSFDSCATIVSQLWNRCFTTVKRASYSCETTKHSAGNHESFPGLGTLTRHPGQTQPASGTPFHDKRPLPDRRTG